MFHQDYDRDSIIYNDVFSEHHSGMCFTQSDQRLKHSDCLPVLCQGCTPTKVWEIGLENHLCFFCANWLDISLNKYYVFCKLVNWPFNLNFIILLFIPCKRQFEVGWSKIIVSILLVNQDEYQVESTQKWWGNSSILITIVSIVPLLGLTWISSS